MWYLTQDRREDQAILWRFDVLVMSFYRGQNAAK